MKLIFATGNKGKLIEAQEILGEGYEIVSAAAAGVDGEAEETGDTLEENSLLKARYVYERCHRDCFADDSGLEVDALNGAPGVYTARYAGPDCNFDDNINKLLCELKDVPYDRRTARFVCVVTLIKDGVETQYKGRVEGKIALQRSGKGGFGYDPVFVPDEFPDMTMADLEEDVKNSISHRFHALDLMRKVL